MDYHFKGKTIIVSGGAGTIGSAIAIRLAEFGATVYALDNNKTSLDDLVKAHADIKPVCQDLQNWDETAKAVDKLGSFDGLVNCAGITNPLQNAVNTPKETLYKVMDVNLNAPINLMQVVGKKMIDSGKGGAIVNISSLLSFSALQGFLPYAVSKAGLDMATKMFALEMGPHGIRVNTVNLNIIVSNLSTLYNPPEVFDVIKSSTPMGRLVEVKDAVELVIFLLSEKSGMISGTNHVLDGGLMCKLP